MRTKPLSQHWKRTIIVGAFSVALIGGYSLGLPKATAMSEALNTESQALQLGPPSFASLVRQVKPAVVNIAVSGKIPNNRAGAPLVVPQLPENSPFYDFFRQFQPPGFNGQREGFEREFQAGGSGFFISADGYVVTNNHVIENADEILVIMQDGKERKAVLKGRDPKTDLALLKVQSDEEFPYVNLGNSDQAEVGEWVIAVGNPFGLGGTVTAGIVSARGRDIQSGPYDDYIQVDAPINRGNSGGPLFDNRGQVIGINTAIYSPSGGNVGIAFAIPSNLAKNVVAQLKDKGNVERGWLGVHIQPIDELAAQSLGLEKQQGALVSDVVEDSPAERAGIQVGDVILSMDGEELKTPKDLSKQVAQTQAGSRSTLKIMRQGKRQNLNVTISQLPTTPAEMAQVEEQQEKGTAKLGIYLSSLTPEARQHFGIKKNTDGVLVTDIEPNSPAARAGIRPGDIISMIGQEAVDSPRSVIEKVELAEKQNKPSILLLVEKRSGKRFVSLEFMPA